MDHAVANAFRVSSLLTDLGFSVSDGPVVEVGSGGHGLIWRWPDTQRIAIDPLAVFYRTEFAYLQLGGPAILAAQGERLPLKSGIASVVLSDNVLDHVQNPTDYLRECRRILLPGGALFLSVDVHHPIYWWAGVMYNAMFRLGFRRVVPAFPNHPFHFTQPRAERLLSSCGFQTLMRRGGRPDHSAASLPHPKGGALQVFKQVFFKNARLEVVAVPV